MRVLIIHNYYQQPGGEDIVVRRETTLLREAGHEIVEYYRSNSEIDELDLLGKIMLPKKIIWASDTARDLEDIIRNSGPDIAHFHNTHFMVSPGAYQTCRKRGVPVVQSLYNPRLMCPAASFYREGEVCQDCLGRTLAWPGIIHACYRGSRIQTTALAASLSFHRLFGTWSNGVDAYITATDFYRQLYVAAGLPAERLYVKPHFIAPDPGLRSNEPGEYALFIGRLDPEKGIQTLLQAWQELNIPLKLRGSGQLLAKANLASRDNPAIEIVDRLSTSELYELIKGARFLVWPSEGLYETFGLVAAEAFACGVPVIASRIGVMADIVTNEVNGVHFEAGDSNDLAEKVVWAWDHPDEMVRLGHTARVTYESNYTAEKNLQQLIAIYEQAIQKH